MHSSEFVRVRTAQTQKMKSLATMKQFVMRKLYKDFKNLPSYMRSLNMLLKCRVAGAIDAFGVNFEAPELSLCTDFIRI